MAEPTKKISEVTRRNIIDSLLLRGEAFNGRLELTEFLSRVWDLNAMPSTDSRFPNASGDIWQHMVNNNDWDHRYLLCSYLKLLTCPDSIFLKFLETCLHPVVLDVESSRRRLTEFNRFLHPDGFRLTKTSEISDRPVYTAEPILITGNRGQTPYYEVVLSFAGEDRAYVEAVAESLKAKGVCVFYDKYEEVTLWGKDLVEHLDVVYRSSSRFCVIFISKHYAQKIWTNHERRSALARAIEERLEYILPARFDDTEIPGLRPTIGYVDLRIKTPEELAQMILAKLG